MSVPGRQVLGRRALGRRVLVVGWASVEDGEATAGDVLSMQAVAGALVAAGVDVDVAYSEVMTPPGGLALARADPDAYSHLVWACGPLHGAAVARTRARFARARALAVGVSVLDADDPVVAGFDVVLARDAPGAAPVRDLAAGPAAALLGGLGGEPAGGLGGGEGGRGDVGRVPVVGVVLAPGQAEYGTARRHAEVTEALGAFLAGGPWACVEIDTRLDPRSWRNPASPAALLALIRRCDVVVSQRLHGLVLSLVAGVPVVAVDPVAGPAAVAGAGTGPGGGPGTGSDARPGVGGAAGVEGKVSAQARAWDWPAVVGAAELLDLGPTSHPSSHPSSHPLAHHLAWCLSPVGRAAAASAAAQASRAGARDLQRVVDLVRA